MTINNSNKSKNYFIYIRSIKKKVPVSKKLHDFFYTEATRTRKRAQYHGQCMCPKSKNWLCDGDCLICEYRAPGDVLSLDATNDGDESANFYNSEMLSNNDMEDIITDRLLLESLLNRMTELDPDGARIYELLGEGLSDRAIAETLGRKQRTFADQMKKYRHELHKVRGY